MSITTDRVMRVLWGPVGAAGQSSGLKSVCESRGGEIMQFESLLVNRRSVRNYLDRQVPVELIREMIGESTLAPSAGNGQPWQFVIVTDPAVMARISDESKKTLLARIAADPEDYAARYKTLLEKEGYNVFYNAPALVMILGQSDIRNLYVDCALAAAYFMLAAASRGLGTCWVSLGRFIKDPDLLQELGIPGGCEIVAPIALGYPVQQPPIPKRKPPKILKEIGPAEG